MGTFLPEYFRACVGKTGVSIFVKKTLHEKKERFDN